MSRQKLTASLAGILFAVVSASTSHGASAPDQRPDEVKVLVMIPRNYGANLNIYLDNFELNGWRVTLTGTTEILPPCPVFAGPRGCLPITVDTLVSEINDITAFDGLAIMSGSASAGSACADLLASDAALNLVRAAVDSGMAVGAWCTAVRVLAAADVLDGIDVTGNPSYQAEYENAGANYVGSQIPPVTDGNIMTCSVGDYYNIQNTNAFAILVDNCRESTQRMWKSWTESYHAMSKKGGELIWEVIFESESSEGFRAVCPTDDGGAVVAGYSYARGAGVADVLVMKTDGQGNEEWSATAGGSKDDRAFDICSTTDGCHIAVGYTHSFGAGSWDVFVVKLDTDGNEVWTRTFGGAGIDVGTSCIETSDGNYVICGYTESDAVGEDDVYVIKIDPDGNELWSKTIGGINTDMGQDICETSDGGLMIAGSTGFHSYPLSTRYMYLIKTDTDGVIQWSHPFIPSPYASYSSANAIAEASDGGFIIAGDADEITGQDLRGIILAKVDSAGTIEWVDRFGAGSYYDSGWDVLEPQDGSFLLIGASKNATTLTSDVYAVLTDCQGNELWHETYGDSGPQWGSAVCMLGHNFLMAGHTATGFGGPYDAWIFEVSSLLAQFTADPVTGHAPVMTQFTDASLGAVSTWEWDFDNDGVTDSDVQHPVWTYDEPGTYTVSLQVGDGENVDTLVQEELVRVFDGESALWFDGESGSATCPAFPSLSLTDAMTIEAWIEPEGWGEVPTIGYGRIVDKTSFALYLHGDGSSYNLHSLVFLLKNESGPPRVITTPPNSIHLEGWQHIAATYDAFTSTVAVYINGFAQDLTFSSTPSGSIRDNSAMDLVIGNNQGGTYTFSGVIDELRVWNSTRTGDEIRGAMGSYLGGDEPGLAGYWTMNEGYGPLIEDGSPYGNNGTITGGSWRQGTPFEPTVPADEEAPVHLPSEYRLHCSYPSPFHASTTIRYALPEESYTILAIYDVSGRMVKTLVSGKLGAGEHSVSWNGTNDLGRHLASGIYFCRMQSGNFSDTRKCLLMR